MERLALEKLEEAILAKHGQTKTSVADAAQLEPWQRKLNEHECIIELTELWQNEAPVVITDAAVVAISDILATLPLTARPDVVERAIQRASQIGGGR